MTTASCWNLRLSWSCGWQKSVQS